VAPIIGATNNSICGAHRNCGHFVSLSAYQGNKNMFLQIEYANWSFYDKKDSAKVRRRQTPSFVGSIGLQKS
jgi:hypothetical protein